jgi:hypothetical protein
MFSLGFLGPTTPGFSGPTTQAVCEYVNRSSNSNWPHQSQVVGRSYGRPEGPATSTGGSLLGYGRAYSLQRD